MPSWAIYGNERRRGIPLQSDLSDEASQFIARIDDPGPARTALYAALIDELVAEGVWANLEALYILAAPDAATALTNLKSSSWGLTANGSPTFTADAGYAGTGGSTTVYLNTGYTPSTSGGILTQNDAHISFWNNTDGAAADRCIGGATGAAGTHGLFIYTNHTGGGTPKSIYYSNQSSELSVAPPGNVAGHFCAVRVAETGANSSFGYFNGAEVIVGDADQPGSGLAGDPIFILSRSNGAGSGGFEGTAQQCAAASFGAALSAAEVAAFHAALDTFLTAI
jgi:hypothetical protein